MNDKTIKFTDLGIISPILKALTENGYTHPSPIQAQAIPLLLENNDLLGCAQTGTGKTAAFTIPILQHLYNNAPENSKKRHVRALVITPTRELAKQVGDSITTYGKFTGIKNTVIFGGVRQKAQTNALQRGVDIIVATPGRLLDLIEQKYINLSKIECCVLDEADHMLDMGFINDIKKIINFLPSKRQSLFFSATMPPEIVSLSKQMLQSPKKITIKPEQTTAERVEQRVYMVSKKDKSKLLIHIITEKQYYSVLIFSRTKHGADKIVTNLKAVGIKSVAIHGNKSQNIRERALKDFKSGKTQVLVATDVAARGIDIKGLSLVINYDLSEVPETYIHRIGRTGRADASGLAISFCSKDQKSWLRGIEKLIKQKILVIDDHPFIDGANEGSNDGSQKFKPRQPRQNNTYKTGQNKRRKPGSNKNNFNTKKSTNTEDKESRTFKKKNSSEKNNFNSKKRNFSKKNTSSQNNNTPRSNKEKQHKKPQENKHATKKNEINSTPKGPNRKERRKHLQPKASGEKNN